MATFEIHPSGVDTGKRVRTLSFTKQDGTAGTIEGIPEWSLSDTTMATMNVAADGMSADILHNGAVGTVTVSNGPVDGDLGVGVHPIQVAPDDFVMMPPLGAFAGVSSVSGETAP